MADMLLTVLTLGCAAVANAAFLVPTPAPFPEQNYEKHHILTAPQIVIDGFVNDVSYKPILRSGQVVGRQEFAFGQLVDQDMEPIFMADRLGNANITMVGNTTIGEYDISQSPDYTSLLSVGGRLFSFVHFESPNPAVIYMVELTQNSGSCDLTAISAQPVDFSEYGGLWTPCAGSVTPWNTHIGSEEYEPNARNISDARNLSQINPEYVPFLRYFGIYENQTTYELFNRYFKPYRYGYVTELTANADGSHVAEKHPAMGRMAFELPLAMPDQRTVYLTDDGDNTMFGMFKADRPTDLSCGTLYGGKFTQLSDVDGGSFNLTWISLGHACDDEILPFVSNTTFPMLFDTASGNTTTGVCPAGYLPSNAGGFFECLRLRPGMEKLASRLETRRYLSTLNGTTEFAKWEGITFDPNFGTNGRLFTSLSEIRYGMENSGRLGVSSTRYEFGGNNDVRLPYNPCGCVYTLEVDANYTAYNFKAERCGTWKRGQTDRLNECDVNDLSQPDNIGILGGHNALIIGEDTSLHQNDAAWLYDLGTKKLTRIFTTPYGSETTGVYYHPEVNGCAYLMTQVQHPYGESDTARINDMASTGRAGYMGYIGPLRTSAGNLDSLAAARARVAQAQQPQQGMASLYMTKYLG